MQHTDFNREGHHHQPIKKSQFSPDYQSHEKVRSRTVSLSDLLWYFQV